MSQDDLWGSLKGEVGFHQVKTMSGKVIDEPTPATFVFGLTFSCINCFRKACLICISERPGAEGRNESTLEQKKNSKTIWDFKTLIKNKVLHSVACCNESFMTNLWPLILFKIVQLMSHVEVIEVNSQLYCPALKLLEILHDMFVFVKLDSLSVYEANSEPSPSPMA